MVIWFPPRYTTPTNGDCHSFLFLNNFLDLLPVQKPHSLWQTMLPSHMCIELRVVLSELYNHPRCCVIQRGQTCLDLLLEDFFCQAFEQTPWNHLLPVRLPSLHITRANAVLHFFVVPFSARQLGQWSSFVLLPS